MSFKNFLEKICLSYRGKPFLKKIFWKKFHPFIWACLFLKKFSGKNFKEFFIVTHMYLLLKS